MQGASLVQKCGTRLHLRSPSDDSTFLRPLPGFAQTVQDLPTVQPLSVTPPPNTEDRPAVPMVQIIQIQLVPIADGLQVVWVASDLSQRAIADDWVGRAG